MILNNIVIKFYPTEEQCIATLKTHSRNADYWWVERWEKNEVGEWAKSKDAPRSLPKRLVEILSQVNLTNQIVSY